MRATGRSDLVDVEVFIHMENDLALFVSGVSFAGSDTRVLLPKNQIEIKARGHFLAEITLPRWLAIEEGLV